jgi:hypothetical protein
MYWLLHVKQVFLRARDLNLPATRIQVSDGADTATTLSASVASHSPTMLPSVTRRYMDPFYV